MTLRCRCGSPEWTHAAPGSDRITTGDDPNVLLLKPIKPKPARAWCAACSPWLRSVRRAESIHSAHRSAAEKAWKSAP